LKLGILVNEGPYTHQASDSAYQFAKAALEKGHEIFRVFFYNDGVNNGTRLTVPPQDDRNLQNAWTDLAQKYNLDLVVCIAAAQRRGTRARLDRLAVLASRLAEVHLRIHHAGQDVQPLAVDHFGCRSLPQCADFGDSAASDADVADALAVLIDHRAGF